MTTPSDDPRLFLRLFFGDFRLGPGKAALLVGIRDTGSISAAGRGMGMSYKRAWMLVEDMNAAFVTPLVESTRGGSGGGGARLTEAGHAVLGHFRSIETAAATAALPDLQALAALLRPTG